MTALTPQPPRSVRLVELIQVVTVEGTGTSDSPAHHIVRLYTKAGLLVAVRDTLQDSGPEWETP